MTPERLRYAQHLMADRSRSIPATCRELGDMPVSTLHHHLHADGSLKAHARKLLDTETRANGGASSKGLQGNAVSIEVGRAHSVA